MLSGPDCSRHQGDVNWRAVAAAGHAFAIIKATEGTSYRYTDWWHYNHREVEAAGLVLGAYHFLRSGNGPAQARFFAATVGSFTGRIAVLDVEKAANGTYPSIGDVREFVAEFRRLVPGHPLVIYTGAWFWKGYLGNPHGADLGPLWHSEYETSAAEVADGPEADRYGGWDGCTIWQWTSSGSCPGVAGRCDLNILRRGSLADLTGSGTAEPTTTPTVQEDDMTYLLQHVEANKTFLVAPGGVTELGPSAVKDYTDAGFRTVTVRSGNHANKVLADADRPRRIEMGLAALGQIEGREEQRDLAAGT